MITTTIVTKSADGFPVSHKSDGFAKNKAVASWIFAFCGWGASGLYAELFLLEEDVEWSESEEYFPCNKQELWVLGGCLSLN
ncbi:hypothetical protein F5984_06725 [Rudanella paleaurantiibacter]|uniref:Uncharacterized protein n=1 Tax=Rudanella paleaurantiibacter TaxID=2614655 RepID=A0A7J5U2J7_9BACT|nr:hypothetical protein [Rudanella paleaurantiibacter]KAB7731910.1 hypothetical protein F5984_06725 [Rudanella paleaurantiibacter]